MKPIRLILRNWIVAVIVVIGVASAVTYGSRVLSAIVVPITISLVIGAIQVWRVSPLRTERVTFDDGFPDGTHTVSLSIDIDRPFPATVPDTLSLGLNGDTAVDSAVGDSRIDCEMTYRGRGPATLSPAAVVIRDILGLLLKSFTVGGITEVFVLPRAWSFGAAARRDLSMLADAGRANECAKSNHLHEYVLDNPLRDIH